MLAIVAESALRSLVLGGAVWIGLTLLRVRNPHVQMTCWVMVLAASLAMPLLTHCFTVTITLDSLPLPIPDGPPPVDAQELEPLRAPLAIQDVPAPVRGETRELVNWGALATAVYCCVAAMLLLRLVVGLYLTRRLVAAARPIHESWTDGADVRVSDVVSGPVTFGATILLPPQCIDWGLSKSRAVLAHEGAHVAHGDFYLLLLASLNRAVFWFSPFAWWQLIRLAELAEIISDARAIEVLEDRVSYAEILLDLMQRGRQVPVGLEMARACTVYSRVERILGATMIPAKLGWRKRIRAAAIIAPVVIVSAGSIAYTTPPPSMTVIGGTAADATAEAQKPRQVDFYALAPAQIFAVFRDEGGLFAQLTWQGKLRLAAEGEGAQSYAAAAGRITFTAGDDRPPELTLHQNGHDVRAARIAQISGPGAAVDAGLLDSYVGWYELSSGRVLTVSREADRMMVQETGRQKFEVMAHSRDAFAGGQDDLVIFLRDGGSKVTRVVFQEPMTGARIAPRIAAAKAKTIEDEFARQMSEVPERFRDQIPAQGGKEAILRGISDLQRGAPNYDRMTAPFAAKIRRQATELQAMMKALGQVESIFFRGVGPGGYDIYGVKFANGSAEFRIQLVEDGKVGDVLFRPDGNEAAGGLAACSDEKILRSHGDTSPIKMVLYNATGRDIRLYRLDSEGLRVAQGAVGDTMSSSVMTYVDSPWVIADTTGQCLQIVLPGQRTRYHTVEASVAGAQPGQPAIRRTTPLAGSEDLLRQYIESVGRGAPNYDRMTPEVAVQTRAQLPLDQAIVTKLGALRAISFRGVTQLGSDIYVAHFANGSAEWRIGLAKDGAIGRIALGPQS